MAVFMAMAIERGDLSYVVVVTKRPDLKDGIDTYLFTKGREDLIVVPE